MGGLASEEVIVQLLKTKCLPVLYHALEACPLNKSETKARKAKFLTNYLKSCNSLCVMFANVAQNELKDLPSCTTAST